MSRRHQARRRRSYSGRQHEVRERRTRGHTAADWLDIELDPAADRPAWDRALYFSAADELAADDRQADRP